MKNISGLLSGITPVYLRHRYALLFYSLLISIAAIPVFSTLRIDSLFLEIFLAANLLAAIIPIGSGRKRLILCVVMIVSFAIQLGRGGEQYRLLNIGIGMWSLVAVLAAASALRFALSASSVETEHIFAALSAYLLAGIFLGFFYWVLEQTWPGTFLTIHDPSGSDFTLASGVYFSFVTLATLGYGDIVPRSDMARGLAIMEAVAGQLYLAVMIARLVSLYVGKKRERKSNVPKNHVRKG